MNRERSSQVNLYSEYSSKDKRQRERRVCEISNTYNFINPSTSHYSTQTKTKKKTHSSAALHGHCGTAALQSSVCVLKQTQKHKTCAMGVRCVRCVRWLGGLRAPFALGRSTSLCTSQSTSNRTTRNWQTLRWQRLAWKHPLRRNAGLAAALGRLSGFY